MTSVRAGLYRGVHVSVVLVAGLLFTRGTLAVEGSGDVILPPPGETQPATSIPPGATVTPRPATA